MTHLSETCVKDTITAKRDFLFVDESGDPGSFSDYYVAGLLHVTDASLLKINQHLGALRYFGALRRELKATRLSPSQKEMLLRILKESLEDGYFVRASAVYVKKKEYVGPYLADKPDYPKDGSKFRNFIIRRLLEFHFSENVPQSSEVEIVVDRIHSSENREQQMRSYLRLDKYSRLPIFLHIVQADSRYVELLQFADWIAGAVKETYFSPKGTYFDDLLRYVHVADVSR